MTSEPRPPDATLLQPGFDPAAATPRVDGTLRDTGDGPASNLSTLPYIAVGPAGGSEFPAIPGYEIVEELGRGGMGVVYRARDQKLNRDVALKMVLGGSIAGATAHTRFLAEAEALAALQHPHVVQVFDRGAFQGLPFFTMEFCPGGSLADRVRLNPLPARAAADVMEKLARGVAAAHARNVLHRDLKPENVLYAADEMPKITDFGLAKRFDDSRAANAGLTHTGAVMGTPSYMAPEQAMGETKRVGPAADVYSLGAILYRLVTGRPPFLGANSMETIRQVIDIEPVSPTQLTPGLPRDLATICLKCLAKDPARRYLSAADLADDLLRFASGQTVHARPIGTAERIWKWARHHRTAAISASAVVLVLVVGIVVSGVYAARATAAEKREAEAHARYESEVMILQIVAHGLVKKLQISDEKTKTLVNEILADYPVWIRERVIATLAREPNVLANALEAGAMNAATFNPNLFGD